VGLVAGGWRVVFLAVEEESEMTAALATVVVFMLLMLGFTIYLMTNGD
jgi:hypothetical protein